MEVQARTAEAQGEELTPREYAEMMGVSSGTAYNRLWQHKLPARKLLNRWLILIPASNAQ